MRLIQPSAFTALFLNDTPLLDVRAEIEFKKGAFPHSINIPILQDAERDRVGRCYKLKGQNAAVLLGHQLVNGQTKLHRIEQWLHFCKKHAHGALYCFRGGMRSSLAQQWLEDAGVNFPRIDGGYKALRRFLIEITDSFIQSEKMIIVAGRTGTGKTRVIHALDCALDLEKYANHRGSAFGQFPNGQPVQINFENLLAIDILKKTALFQETHSRYAIEDESRLIGKNALPPQFKVAMGNSPVVQVEESLSSRVSVVIEEYVTQLSQIYLKDDEISGWGKYCDYMLNSLKRIEKRLGGVLTGELLSKMKSALDEQRKNDQLQQHENWIIPLLEQYYDKMYDYQLRQKKLSIQFKGSRNEVIDFLKNCNQ